jgi:hypothetical protein
MRKKYSAQKIGLVLFLTVGISLGLYYGLDNPNVLSYAVPLDVSSEGVEELIEEYETSDSCYQKINIRYDKNNVMTTLTCSDRNELEKIDGVKISNLGEKFSETPNITEKIQVPSLQPSCPVIQSIRTADVSQCNYIASEERNLGNNMVVDYLLQTTINDPSDIIEDLQEDISNRDKYSRDYNSRSYKALNHQAGNTVNSNQKPYVVNQLPIMNLLLSVEKKYDDLNKLLDDGSITCDIKSTTIVDFQDGTVERFESKVIQSAIYSLELDSTSDDNAVKIGDKQVKNLRVIPSIMCESLPAPLSIEKSNLTFNVSAENSEGDTKLVFSDGGESKLIQINSPDEYELMRLELPPSTIIDRVNSGNYDSMITIDVSGNIPINFEGLQKSEIVIPSDTLKTEIQSSISKKSAIPIQEVIEPEVIASEPIFYLENSFIEDDWGFAVEKSPTVSLAGGNVVQDTTSPTDALIQFFDYLLSGDFEKLNDEKFLTIYLMIVIFIVIALLFRRDGRQYILLKK